MCDRRSVAPVRRYDGSSSGGGASGAAPRSGMGELECARKERAVSQR